MTMILDRAPQHRSKNSRRKFGRDENIRFAYLPRRAPYLNMIEEHW